MEANTKQEQATPKITSDVKVKNPLRVAQGKRLAAISREAKARKAKERDAIIRKEETEKCEKENYLSYAIVPTAIGILVFGGYYFLQRKKPDDDRDNNVEEEKPSRNSNLENL